MKTTARIWPTYTERKCHKPLYQFKSFYTLSISLLSYYLDPQSSICYCSFWRRQFQRERGAPDSNPPSLHCYHKHMLENQMNTHYTSIFRNQISTHGRGEVGGVDLTGLPLLPPYSPARPLFTSGNYIYWSTGQDIHGKTLKLPGLPFLLVIEIGVSLGILFSKDYISERLKFRKHPSPS